MLVSTKPLIDRSPEGVWLENQRRSIRALPIIDSPDIRVEHSNQGQSLFLTSVASGSRAAVTKLILKDAAPANYLICRPWNEAYWTARRDIRQEKGYTDFQTLVGNDSNYRTALAERMAITKEVLAQYLGDPSADPVVPERLIRVAKVPELRADDLDGYEEDIEVESWSGSSLSSATQTLSYEYPSATLRIVTQMGGDGHDVAGAAETQIIIPRFIAEESIIYADRSTEPKVGSIVFSLIDTNRAARAWMRST